MDLSGARVLVTGGSRGIGAALADAFQRAGAHVALVARESDALRSVAERTGGVAYPFDLARTDAIGELVQRIGSDGPVDVLVNNAGVANVGWFLDRTPEEIEQVVAVNLLAPLLLCRHLLPGMADRGRGHVVSVSSMAGVIAPPGLVAYGATKAGLSHATAVMAQDLRGYPGIGFTTVHLGSVRTEMDDEARSYGPLRQLAANSGGRDITPMGVVVDGVVDAVRRGRPQVRYPRSAAPLAAAAELPRRIGRALFARAMTHEARRD